jgi:cbb3-type cytochrome oxidase subunit 3
MNNSGFALVPAIFGIGFGLLIFIVYVASIIWAYGDAERRGKSGCLVALLVFLLTWPVGLIAWIIFRPEKRE